jgi:hypothetical protein
MDSSLFRRLIEGLSPRPDTWPERPIQDHDVDDFVPLTDREIATIAAFLYEEFETMKRLSIPIIRSVQFRRCQVWSGM